MGNYKVCSDDRIMRKMVNYKTRILGQTFIIILYFNINLPQNRNNCFPLDFKITSAWAETYEIYIITKKVMLPLSAEKLKSCH